jgi:hypothetical protein
MSSELTKRPHKITIAKKRNIILGVVKSMSALTVVTFAAYMLGFSVLALGLFFGLRAVKLI